MKMKYLINILLKFTFIYVILANNNVSNLWSKEFLGKPYSVRYTNSDEILLSTTKGIISKLRIDNGEVAWRKNMIHKTNLEVDGKGQYYLLVNKQDRYIDLINNNNSQLIWSFSFDRVNSKDEIKGLKWKLLKMKDNFMGILFESSNIKIFNNERVLADIEANEKEEFLDFFTDANEENLFVLCFKEGSRLEVKQLELSLQSITSKSQIPIISKEIILNGQKSGNNSIKIKESFILKDYAFILSEDNNYYYFDYKKNGEIIQGSIELPQEETLVIRKFENINTIVYLDYDSVKIFPLQLNSVKLLNTDKKSKEELFFDFVDNSQTSSIYLFRKRNANSYILYEVDLLNKESRLEEISSHIINEEINIVSFTMNQYDQKNYFLITKENRIYFFDLTNKNYLWKSNQSLTNIQFSELITYFKEETDQKIHSYNDFHSVFKNKQFMKVFLNIFNNILMDLSDIVTRIKKNFLNMISFNKNTSNISNLEKDKKVYHNLIVFTRDSEELYVINGLTGEIKLIRQFKNSMLYKIVKNPDDSNNNDKHVYLILKDKSNNTVFSSYRLDLESTELTIDNNIIELVKIEDEISKLSDNLIKNESDTEYASLNSDLKVNYNSDFLKRFLNKYTIKSANKGLYGFKFNNNKKLNLAWNINMKPFSIQYPNIHKNVITTYHSAGKVFYKYIDSNNMLTLTNLSNKTLVVSIIRATNGKVLHQTFISNVDFSQKILSVFEENIILISYMKKEKNVRRNEIHAIEIMKREIEHSLLQMLEKIFKINLFKENTITDQDLLNEVQESDLVFLSHTYILPRKLKGLFTTKTLLNVENKYFVFLFENNQTFLVDKRLVSPRRPLAMEDKSKPGTNILDPTNSPYVDPELTPYNPLVVFDYKQILNVDFFMNQIDNILISPTLFESTFLLCAEGSNLTCYKVSPDKTFDGLSVSFSYAQIALFLTVVISIAFMLRRYVKKNEFKNIFINTA